MKNWKMTFGYYATARDLQTNSSKAKQYHTTFADSEFPLKVHGKTLVEAIGTVKFYCVIFLSPINVHVLAINYYVSFQFFSLQ